MVETHPTRCLEASDAIDINLAQLQALIALPLADDRPEESAFALMSEEAQRNYLWACQGSVQRIATAWKSLSAGERRAAPSHVAMAEDPLRWNG